MISADGTAHRIGPEWSEPAARPTAVGPQTPRTLQLVLDTGSGGLLQYDPSVRLAAVHEYLARNRDGHALAADETTLAKAGHAHIRDVNYDPNDVIRLAGCVGFQTTLESLLLRARLTRLDRLSTWGRDLQPAVTLPGNTFPRHGVSGDLLERLAALKQVR